MALDPITYHRRYHASLIPFTQCWRCQRARAICRSKIRFATRADVDVAVLEINEREGYAEPVMRYPCGWCEGYHITHARTPVQLRRAERARRKGQRPDAS